ncbi:TAF2 [Acrasis kona]|uniref:TAF2 n=1 Tax=Acrasis kona TaxID=1008807 RepID=A0AAW2ZRM8_9EUKA
MWNNQLDKDRDVVAQLDAIEALVNFHNKNDQAIAKLATIIASKAYRVRMAAAKACSSFYNPIAQKYIR